MIHFIRTFGSFPTVILWLAVLLNIRFLALLPPLMGLLALDNASASAVDVRPYFARKKWFRPLLWLGLLASLTWVYWREAQEPLWLTACQVLLGALIVFVMLRRRLRASLLPNFAMVHWPRALAEWPGLALAIGLPVVLIAIAEERWVDTDASVTFWITLSSLLRLVLLTPRTFARGQKLRWRGRPGFRRGGIRHALAILAYFYVGAAIDIAVMWALGSPTFSEELALGVALVGLGPIWLAGLSHAPRKLPPWMLLPTVILILLSVAATIFMAVTLNTAGHSALIVPGLYSISFATIWAALRYSSTRNLDMTYLFFK